MIAFIDDHRDVHGVEPICRVLPIAPSTYHVHAARQADPAKVPPRAKSDAVLMIEIRPGLARLDHRPSAQREELQVALHLAHGARRALVGLAGGRAPERGHELLEHEERGVGQSLLEPDRGGGQHGVSTKRVECQSALKGTLYRRLKGALARSWC